MKTRIAIVLKKALIQSGIILKDEEIENLIEIPHSSEVGDYAFPCFSFAKRLNKNPQEIAYKIKEKIKDKDFEKIQAVNGYVNFFIERKKFSEEIIKKIMKDGESFGRKNIGKGKKVLIEHTSINPNASPHVGRARNAIIGDSLVKIHEFLGFKPEVHYYVNDVSKQIAMLVLAKAEKLKFEAMLSKYSEIAKKVEESEELEKKVFEILYEFEKGNKDIIKKVNKIVATSVNGQKKILAELGINYDFFDYESEYLNKTEEIISELKKTGKLFVDEYGRNVIELKNTVVERKMKFPVLVLTRNDGTGLYALRDIAYTIDKIKKSKNNIIVLGEDQKLYFQQLKEALKLLNYKSPEVVHYSFILLSSSGKSKKMSTRSGDVVLLEDFLKETNKKAMKKSKNSSTAKKISVAAVKYTILKNHPNKSINFNLDDALNFEGDTGPYLLYSYARACSIINKVKKKVKTNISIEDLNEKEFELVKALGKFPEVVLNSYKTLNPSIIANYSHQLSQLFNEFYHSSKVIGSENEHFRIMIVESFKTVIKNSLFLLGISVVEKM